MSNKLPIPQIVLASTSPRRQELLRRISIDFVVIPPHPDEATPDIGNCAATALENARRKAASVAGGEIRLVLGADTIVDLDGVPLNKPANAAHAMRMLKLLSGRTHLVHTGICLIDETRRRVYEAVETSVVKFRMLGEKEIRAYVATGEPLDKAGAYGIQERGAMLVERIEGCFFNVMGLPLARLWILLKQWMADRGTPMNGW
jgi:septum formation protein